MKGWEIGKIFGISIEIHWTWLIIFYYFSEIFSYFFVNQIGLSEFSAIFYGILTCLGLWISVLIHELAHCLMANRNNIPIKRVTFFILGGMAHTEEEPDSAWVEFKIAIIGPISSLLCFLVFYALFVLFIRFYGSFLPGLTGTCLFLFSINFILAIFNLIPFFPMDGGRCFVRAPLWFFLRDVVKATKYAIYISSFLASLTIVYGFYETFFKNHLEHLWWPIISISLIIMAKMELETLAKKIKNKN